MIEWLPSLYLYQKKKGGIMSRLSKLRVGVLNVKLHPHSDELYLGLFEALSRLDRSTKIWGTRFGVFSKPQRLEEDGQVVGLRGYSYTFTEIDPQQPLFDMKEFRQLELEEGQPFPFSLRYKLHSKEVLWLFWLEKHLMFFDLAAIGHEWARKFLLGAVQNEGIVNKYGIVEVEVVASSDTIDKILGIPKLTKIRVVLSRPNGDDPEGIMARIRKRMEVQKVKTYIQEIQTPVKEIKDEEEGMKPDDDFKAHMLLAITDGGIYAEGRDAYNAKLVESTAKYPLELTDEYDARLEDRVKVMQRIVEGATIKGHEKLD